MMKPTSPSGSPDPDASPSDTDYHSAREVGTAMVRLEGIVAPTSHDLAPALPSGTGVGASLTG